MNASAARLALLLVPGVGFILVFLGAAVAMTLAQSFGLYNLIGDANFTLDHWRALAEKGFLDSLLFSIKVGIGSAFGTLIFSYPLALFLRRQGFGSRTIGSIIKVPLFVPALVAAFLILNMLAF